MEKYLIMIECLEDFHEYIGKTLMECQAIEHDIHLIYAGMLAGNMNDNLSRIEKNTLGQVLKLLYRLDHSDNNQFFSNEDYKLLKEITEIRNHWAHKGYCCFMYSDDNNDFYTQAKQLENDFHQLKSLSATIEKVRFKCLKQYGRI